MWRRIDWRYDRKHWVRGANPEDSGQRIGLSVKERHKPSRKGLDNNDKQHNNVVIEDGNRGEQGALEQLEADSIWVEREDDRVVQANW